MKKIFNILLYPLDYLLEFRIVHAIQNKMSNEVVVVLISMLIVVLFFLKNIYNY